MSAPPPQSDRSVEPAQIGPYRVQRRLGQGGTGVVYQAIDPRIARTVAIKVLPPDEPEFHARLLNEARAVNIVRHRSIVGVTDVGRMEDGSAYLVMDFLDGQTLRTLLASRPPRRLLLRLARQIASALAATHRSAIIHRDLKPDNVMVVDDDEVADGKRAIVFDFGIAKLAAEQKHPSTQQDQTDLRFALGTAAYMAPEQATGEPTISDRVDVYALGVMLYELLSGAPPFSARSYALLLDMHRYTAPLPLAKLAPDAPRSLAALVMRMLAKAPEERPAMVEVAAVLDAALRDEEDAAPEEAARVRPNRDTPEGTGRDLKAKLRSGPSEVQPTSRKRRQRNTEPLPQRRDSTTLPISRLIAAEETLPPMPRPAPLAAASPSAPAVVAPLQDSETMPIARTSFTAGDEDANASAEGDTRPPLNRQSWTASFDRPLPPQILLAAGLLLFGLGYLLRACS